VIPALIPKAEVAAAWPVVEGWLSEALGTGHGELDAGQLRLLLVRGDARLIVLRDSDAPCGALAIEFQDFPAYRVGHVIAAGGRDLSNAPDAWAQIKEWLRNCGCRHVQAWCGEAQTRLWRKVGMVPAYSIVRAEL
jgi:hypothetical protein